MLRKSLVLTFTFLLFSSTSASGWIRPFPPNDKDSFLGIESRGLQPTYIWNVKPTLFTSKSESYELSKVKVTKVGLCGSFPSIDCPLSQYQWYTAPLGRCEDFKTDCVKSVYAELRGSRVAVNFVRYFPERNDTDFVGNSAYNLPTPGSSFLVSIPAAPHKNGDLYLVMAMIWGQRYPSDPKFITGSTEFAIYPVQIKNGRFQAPSTVLDSSLYGNTLGPIGIGGTCLGEGVQTTENECALIEDYPIDLKFGLSLKISTKTSNWFFGRISNVAVRVEDISRTERQIDIEAEPVKVPILYGWVKQSEMPKNLKAFYDSLSPAQRQAGTGFGCLNNELMCPMSEMRSPLRTPFNDLDGIRELSAWLPILNDKAASSETLWYGSSINYDIPATCANLESKFLGVVSTNANSYVTGAPDFNRVTKTLDYKVIAPHSLEDGSIFRGTYDLVINSQLARCIYGFTDAPISASVTIVSEGGENQITSAITSESAGYLRVSVKGFTFSNPTLRVKLQQPGELAMSSAKKLRSQQKAITCVKGKLTRTVTGLSPKCPAGFIQKAAASKVQPRN